MSFDKYVYPVQSEVGNCSACGFRNWPKLCKQMTCCSKDHIVYWTSDYPGLDTGTLLNQVMDLFELPESERRELCLQKIESLAGEK